MKGDSIGRITAAKLLHKKIAMLYTGEKFQISDLSLKNRKVSTEFLVI